MGDNRKINGAEDARDRMADSPNGGAKGRRNESSDLPDWLGKGLRELYDDVLNDPVPDDFQDLLDKLDRKTGGRG